MYLDAKGLVALWREALLAKRVLERKTKGYQHHPQLHRFKALRRPLAGIHQYLKMVNDEAERRGYNFDRTKFKRPSEPVVMNVTAGQLQYEYEHLLKKLKKRSNKKYQEIKKLATVQPHPLFKKVNGAVEHWEIVR